MSQVSSNYTLPSSNSLLLSYRVSKYKTLGDLTFSVTALIIWNELPLDLQRLSSLEIFKGHSTEPVYNTNYRSNQEKKQQQTYKKKKRKRTIVSKQQFPYVVPTQYKHCTAALCPFTITLCIRTRVILP